MEKSLKPVWKHALSWGFLAALVVIILSLISYMANIGDSKWMQWVQILIVIAMVVVSQVFYKNENPGLTIRYGKALGVGMLTGVFAALILAIYNYLFFAFIAPDLIEYIRQQAEIAVLQQDIPASAQQKALEAQQKFITPVAVAVMSIFQIAWWVLIGVLISSAFTKGIKQVPVVDDDNEEG
ncbi:MAG: DUF4199 domain-containing protein [Candidatus Delongbacteria bacterium]|jgi:hypothetical protein|nr:DUF4199 domain-containing protein [Candidatus Delongbacteria bacterium]